MNDTTRVAVTSRSFSKHPILRSELLGRYPNVTFNDEGKTLAGDSLVAFLKGHSKAITALERIDDEVLSKLPELKVIGKVGVGLDMLDLEAMERRGVLLGWAGGTNRRSVSELALLLMMAALRQLGAANADLRSGAWKQRKGRTLSGRVVGLVGLGNVGKDLAALLAPFGCRILGYDVRIDEQACRALKIEPMPLDDLLRQAEVVSLHLPFNAATRGLFDAGRLALMRPGAILVNTARGGVVDEGALKTALKEGKLGAAAFDVFAQEPPADPELLSLPSFLGTPHIAGSTEEAVLAMGRAAIRGLDEARPAKEFLTFQRQ
ncbi:MAG: phosphoglycerate dehydrogenase [Elusimicrobia bacterium]|nr:phosphoglycerate dehydrogenase [Elusimicrobiota bacterium]